MEPEQHLCHAVGCYERVLPTRLMCPRHWFMVPKPLRTLVWRTYVPGQEITKRVTAAYMEAARNAINHVAEQEGRPCLMETQDFIKTIERLIAQEKNDV